MKINGSYVVFPYQAPNDTAARVAMCHGMGLAHHWEKFTVELPDELVENPDKWFDENGKRAFAEMVMAMPGKIPTWAGYTIDHEHGYKNVDDVIDVSVYRGRRVIRILGCSSSGVFFYLPKEEGDD